MITIGSLIFWVFTIAFIVGMVIHMSKVSYGGYVYRGKRKWEVGVWGGFMIIGYVIFLAIFGGVYWW